MKLFKGIKFLKVTNFVKLSRNNNLIVKNNSSKKPKNILLKFVLTQGQSINISSTFSFEKGSGTISVKDKKNQNILNLSPDDNINIKKARRLFVVVLKLEPKSIVEIKKIEINLLKLNDDNLIPKPKHKKLFLTKDSIPDDWINLVNDDYEKIILIESSEVIRLSEGSIHMSFSQLREYLFDNFFEEIHTTFFDKRLAQVFDAVYLEKTKIIINYSRFDPLIVYAYMDQPYFFNHFEYKKFPYLDDDNIFAFKKYAKKQNVLFVIDSNFIKKKLYENYQIKINNSILNTNFKNYKLKYNNLNQIKNIGIISNFEDNINNSVYRFIEKIKETDDYNYNFYSNNPFGNIILKPILGFSNVLKIEHQNFEDIVSTNDLIILLGNNNPKNNEYIYNLWKNNIPFLVDASINNFDLPEEYKLDITKKLKIDIPKNSKLKLNYEKYENYSKKIILNSKTYKIEAQEPLLTVVIPSYKVEKYLKNAVQSILDSKYLEYIEIIIVNDGSPDNTVKVAKEIVKDTNGLVRLIDKENGGHGSTINVGIAEARGKYFKLLDGDDYFYTDALDVLIEFIKKTEVDIILTDLIEDFSIDEIKIKTNYYEFLESYKEYNLNNLEDEYAFKSWGPLLSTATYKTSILKVANFKHDEHCFYVDMEYNLINYIYSTTFVYIPIYVYNYYLGRADQSVSRDSFIKNYFHHEKVSLRLLEEYQKYADKISNNKKMYLKENIIIPICKLQYELAYSYIKSKSKFSNFDKKIKAYPEIYNLDQINTKLIKFHRFTNGIFCFANNLIEKIIKE